MGIDKLCAKLHMGRISEKTLLLFSFFGALGGILGMFVFRHKTRKLKFQILLPIFILADILAYIYLYYGGYL
jgi:uncharacterized membrane protein YsdA (DUF1294 family)